MDLGTLQARGKDSLASALVLLVAAAGAHGSSSFHRHILPLELEGGSSGTDPQCQAVNTADGGSHLRNSRPRTQAWARSGAAGGLPWGPSGTGGSHGHLAIDGTSLRRAKREAQADDTRLAEGRGLDPVTGQGASPGAAATGESQAPSPTF